MRSARRPPFGPAIAAAVLLVVALLSVFELSGSSVGSFHRAFEGETVEDPDLLFGEPRPIRSDEWLRWTPLVVSQSQQDYPRVNSALRDGIDLSIIDDVPHRGWTALFEPQHYLFFIGVDVESAFSFKWFGILGYCWAAATIFARRVGGMMPGSSMLAGLFFAGAPFFHWWFQSQAFLPVAHGLLLLTVLHASLDGGTLRRRFGLGLIGGYLASAALIIQYPPFLLGAALPSLVFLCLLLWTESRVDGPRIVLRRIAPTAATTVVMASAVLAAFVIEKADLISSVADSEFPGGRSFTSGLGDMRFLWHILSGNLSTNLLSDQRASLYFINQSEASNFFVILPSLMIYTAVAAWLARRRSEPVDVVTLGLTGFAVLIAIWLFVPGVTTAFRPLLLPQVPLYRFTLMIGVTQFLMLVRLLGSIEAKPRPPEGLPAAASVIALFTLTVVANRMVIADNPGFVGGRVVLFATTLALTAGVGLALLGRVTAGLGVLGALTLASSLTINPLYRGLDPVIDTPIVDRIEELSATDPTGAWVTNGGLFFENLAVQAGARSLSGSAPHTQAEFWRENFSTEPDVEVVVDRAAHFVFRYTDEPTSLELDAKNVVSVNLNPCGDFAAQTGLRYVVSVRPLASPCLELVDTVAYERMTFLIYHRS